MGGDPPEQKPFFQGPWGQNLQGSDGEGSPQKGEIEKVPRPQNFPSPFSRKIVPKHISKISGMKGDPSLCQQPEPFSLLSTGNCVTIKIINFHFGGLALKFDRRPP